MSRYAILAAIMLTFAAPAVAGPFGGYMDNLGEHIAKAAGGDGDHHDHGGGHQG